MANSSIVSEMKNKIISEIINDEAIFYAINSPDVTDVKYADDLVYTHIFPYNQNPNTLKKTITFITIQVHTAKQHRYDAQDMWTRPTLEIWIISHESCMVVDNIPKISADRNDYLSQLLDEKFNGRTSLGMKNGNSLNLLGSLELVENTEGAFSQDYLYRKMVFITRDINSSICESR